MLAHGKQSKSKSKSTSKRQQRALHDGQAAEPAFPLQKDLEYPHPISEQNLLDFLVAKSTLDQFPRKIARV